MDDILFLIGAGALGMVLGGIYFGGLWWTVQKIVGSAQPARWLVPSFVLRVAAVLAGFWFAGAGHWQRILACLVGFLVGRFLVKRLTAPGKPRRAP